MPTPPAVLAVVQRVTQSAAFRAIAPAIIPRIDKAVHRLTGGKHTMSESGVPTVVLTTIGARSGEKRVSPLATVVLDDDWYVVGSNFGREKHPAWTANLMKNPEVSISFRGEDIPVRAHLLDPAERAETWPRLLEKWAAWQDYQDRLDREIRVFRLARR